MKDEPLTSTSGLIYTWACVQGQSISLCMWHTGVPGWRYVQGLKSSQCSNMEPCACPLEPCAWKCLFFFLMNTKNLESSSSSVSSQVPLTHPGPPSFKTVHFAKLQQKTEIRCINSATWLFNFYGTILSHPLTSQVAQMVKNLPAIQETQVQSLGWFQSWVGKIPWRREWLPTPVLLPGESYRQRSLVGYSP